MLYVCVCVCVCTYCMFLHPCAYTHTNCRNLKFDETPNYNYCRKLLREVFEANGYSLDYVYDWTVKQQVSPPSLSLSRARERSASLSLSLFVYSLDYIYDWTVNQQVASVCV